MKRKRENSNLRCAASRSNNLNRRCLRASSALRPNQKSMTFHDISGSFPPFLDPVLLSSFPPPPLPFHIYGTRSRGTVIFIPRSQLYFSTGLFHLPRRRENDKLLSGRRITHTHLGLVASLPHNTPKYEGGWHGNKKSWRFARRLAGRASVAPNEISLVFRWTNRGASSDNARHERHRCTRAILGNTLVFCPTGTGFSPRCLMSFPRLSSPCFSHTFHRESFAVYACLPFGKNFPLEVVPPVVLMN